MTQVVGLGGQYPRPAQKRALALPRATVATLASCSLRKPGASCGRSGVPSFSGPSSSQRFCGRRDSLRPAGSIDRCHELCYRAERYLRWQHALGPGLFPEAPPRRDIGPERLRMRLVGKTRNRTYGRSWPAWRAIRRRLSTRPCGVSGGLRLVLGGPPVARWSRTLLSHGEAGGISTARARSRTRSPRPTRYWVREGGPR